MSKKYQKKPNTFMKKWMLALGVILLLIVVVLVVKYASIGKEKDSQEAEENQSYDPLQCVELGQYTGVRVSLKVTQEDLQSEIESLLEENAVYEQISGAVQDGDMVYADFEGYVSGQKMDITCGSDYIEVGSGEWLEGFESSLLGVNTGETAVFTIPVPEDTYGDEAIDGKDVEFHVTVKYICGDQIMPDYNDEFVQSISQKYKTTKEYNAHLKKRLKKENEEQKAEFVWSEVQEVCKVKKYPDSLVESSGQEVLQGYYDMAVVYNCSREEVFEAFGYENEQTFVENYLDELAKDTAKEYLIAEAIAAREGISYTAEDYEALKTEEYAYQEGNYDTIEAFEADKKTYLENQTLLKKVKEWLSEQAEYTE